MYAHPCRVDGPNRVNLFELVARMSRVVSELPVSRAGLHLNLPPYHFKSSVSYSSYESNRFSKQDSVQVALSLGMIF